MSILSWVFGKKPKRTISARRRGAVEVKMNADGTQTETPVEETVKGKLFEIIASGKCPDCRHRGFYEGPSGGMSTNIICANRDCRSKFNVTPMGLLGGGGIAEPIGKQPAEWYDNKP